MSVKCQNCGAEQPGGKFCASCGGPMMPVAAAQMPSPQPMPPAGSGGGKGWILWAAIGGGVLLVGAIAAFLLLRDKPAPTPPAKPDTVQTDPAKPAPQPATPAANTALKKIGQGSFGARPSTMVVSGSYLGYGKDNTLGLYKFDAQGQAKELARVDVKDPVGKLKSVVVGQPYNDGKTYMLALYETKLYIIGEAGGVLKAIDAKGVENVLLGDFDGDGKNETIYMGLDTKGTYGFEVWRYPSDKWEYTKEGRQQAWPELFQTDIKAGKNSLLMGYAFEGNDLYLLLYKWDGIGGPVVTGKFLVENKAESPVEWIASGTTGYGSTLGVVRSGAKANIELLSVAADLKSAKSFNRFDFDGKGRPAVIVGKFTGQNSQLLIVDEAGGYTLYDLGK